MTGPRGDDAPEFVPLGKKVEYPAPERAEWVKTDAPGIEISTKTGCRRTAVPVYENANRPFYTPPGAKP